MEKLAKIAHFNEWIHIDNFDVEHIEILPTIKIIHCDTRDFNIIPNISPHDMGLKDKIKYPNSVIKDTEISMSCVLVDDNNKSYATGSKVFTIQMMRYLDMFGLNNEGFEIKIVKNKTEKGNKALGFELV